MAAKAGLPRLPLAPARILDFDTFLLALVHAVGSAGPDGWEASELQSLYLNAEWLICELYLLLVRMSCTIEFLGHVWLWRACAIRKRASGEAWPIAVGSVLASDLGTWPAAAA